MKKDVLENTKSIINRVESGIFIYDTKDCELSFKEIKKIEKRIFELEEKNEKYEKALKKIANPISELSKEIKEQGYDFDGMMAINLEKDYTFYQDIAVKVLKE